MSAEHFVQAARLQTGNCARLRAGYFFNHYLPGTTTPNRPATLCVIAKDITGPYEGKLVGWSEPPRLTLGMHPESGILVNYQWLVNSTHAETSLVLRTTRRISNEDGGEVNEMSERYLYHNPVVLWRSQIYKIWKSQLLKDDTSDV